MGFLMLKIKKCKYGRGLFTTESIKKGEIVEVSPVIVIPASERKLVEFTEVQSYLFEWTGNKQALALGLGSLFNHSVQRRNVTWDCNYRRKTITFKALKDIKKGSQLFINYGYSMRKVKAWRKIKREAAKELLRGELYG